MAVNKELSRLCDDSLIWLLHCQLESCIKLALKGVCAQGVKEYNYIKTVTHETSEVHSLEVYGKKCGQSCYFLAERKQLYEFLVRLSSTKSKGRISNPELISKMLVH